MSDSLQRPDGSIRADASDLARRLYAQDASPYEELPLGVAFPANAGECADLVAWAARTGVSLIPRGGGTSLAGQCVGPGWIVDTSRHLRAIGKIDPAARTALVEPGAIQDDLNDAAAAFGLQFAPDTSTSRQATIGGMIGNNSCGAYSIIHGTTRDHVLALDVVLADGSRVRIGPLSRVELAARMQAQNLEGKIYRDLFALAREHAGVIRAAYPKASVHRRNAGYALDWLVDHLDDEPFNLAPFLCGSEGTLALITAATVRLVPRPAHCVLLAVHFETVEAACRTVPRLNVHRPWAVELIDGALLDATRHHREHRHNHDWVTGTPGAVLAIEWQDDDPVALAAVRRALAEELRAAGEGYAWTDVAPSDVPRVWALRKAGLGLLTGIPGDAKPLPGLEDASVAPEDLSAYVRAMQDLFARHHCACVYYGHAAAGLLHLRPMLNPRDPRDVETWRALMDGGAEIVRSFRGCFSGEHGDGRLRAPFLPRLLGAEAYALNVRVKTIFDPDGRFNPGKIVSARPWTEGWRAAPGTPAPVVRATFDWSAHAGFRCAVENCNGVGQCRQSAGRGGMCPTYVATGDETHSTRGRANLLRQALRTGDDEGWPADAAVAAALATCLACKACATECPSGIDMARMKSEWLHRRGSPRLRDRITGHYAAVAAAAQAAPALASRLANQSWVKSLLGFAALRPMPPYAARTFSRWWRERGPAPASNADTVALFIDEFTEYGEPEVGAAAVRVLEAAGYTVVVPGFIESGRTQISKGLLDAARGRVESAVRVLEPLVGTGLPVIGLEPSALLTYRDEAEDLVRPTLRDAARHVAGGVFLFEEFVAAHAARFGALPWPRVSGARVLVHTHCHQRALAGARTAVAALTVVPGLDVIELPPACCGMAGAFGYEAEHYALSMQVGEASLFPAIRAVPDAEVCAAGTSCRQQIRHGTGRATRHPAQVLARQLDG